MAAPTQVKNRLKASPIMATNQLSFRADWIKTPPKKTNEILRKCLPICFFIKLCTLIYELMNYELSSCEFSTTYFLRNQGEKSDPAPGRHGHTCLGKYGAAAGLGAVWVGAWSMEHRTESIAHRAKSLEHGAGPG
ncbi:MAG: hypothetical protein U9R02_14590 [Thermodesulfobacteriota bacterium]|nr:hypothetical protein [Thermodesulfobacteriota bacterium]